MNITLDAETLFEAVRASVSEAVIAGVGAWTIKHGIEEAATAAIDASGLVAMIGPVMETTLRERASEITQRVVEESLPGITLACVESLRSALITMVATLREHGYMTTQEREALRRAVREELWP